VCGAVIKAGEYVAVPVDHVIFRENQFMDLEKDFETQSNRATEQKNQVKNKKTDHFD
jgi:hypothetical protein